MLRMLPFYWLFIYAAFDGLSQIQIVVKVTSGIRNVTFKDLVTFEDFILSIFFAIFEKRENVEKLTVCLVRQFE